MGIAHDTTHTLASKAATTATYGGSSAAVYFGMTANEIAAFGGLAIAVIGLLVNWWYKHQHLKLVKKKIDEQDSE
jgi:hypothetical protein